MNERYSQEGVGHSGTGEDVFYSFFDKEKYAKLSSLLESKMEGSDDSNYEMLQGASDSILKGFNVPKGKSFSTTNPLGKIDYKEGSRYSGKKRFFDLAKHSDAASQNKPTKTSKFEQDFVPSFVTMMDKHKFLKDYPLEQIIDLYTYVKQSMKEELEALLDENEITHSNIDMWFKDMEENRSVVDEKAAAKSLFSNLTPDIHKKLVNYIQEETGMTKVELVNEVGDSVSLSDLYSYLELLG